MNNVPAYIRGYDVRTGKLIWTFHTVPHPGEFGNETWSVDSWKDRMGTNVWSMMSVDQARGMIFLPIGSPAYDFFGGDRFTGELYRPGELVGKGLFHAALDQLGNRIFQFFLERHPQTGQQEP